MKKPNVLFLFSDQQRWDTLSCYGESLSADFQLTPRLDALAAEGTRFNQAITCQPVCGPARACIQTGRYPSLIGCSINDRMLPPDATTIAKLFHGAGYETAYVGKWHLASHKSFHPGPDSVNHKITAIPPELRGGYEDFWIAADVLEFTSHGYGGFMFDGDGNRRDFEGYRADATTDFALEFLRQSHDRPFFLFVSYIEPHHQNDRKQFEGPEGSQERFANYSVPGDLAGREGDWVTQMPDYLGCCRSLDDNVGRILDELKAQGLYEDTVILYTSDHGCHFHTRKGEYKRTCHESSIHVPFVATGPGFRGGHVVNQLTSLIDIAPTLLTAAGIPVPEEMPGKPMQQLVADPDRVHHTEVFIQISELGTARAIRTPRYTLCAQAPEDTPADAAGSDCYTETECYDLETDPFQRHNLTGDPAYEEIRSALRERLAVRILEEEGIAAQVLAP